MLVYIHAHVLKFILTQKAKLIYIKGFIQDTRRQMLFTLKVLHLD